MTEKLKTCPFCGGKVKRAFAYGTAIVWCPMCLAQIRRTDDYEEGDSMPQAIEAWNRRANDEKID